MRPFSSPCWRSAPQGRSRSWPVALIRARGLHWLPGLGSCSFCIHLIQENKIWLICHQGECVTLWARPLKWRVGVGGRGWGLGQRAKQQNCFIYNLKTFPTRVLPAQGLLLFTFIVEIVIKATKQGPGNTQPGPQAGVERLDLLPILETIAGSGEGGSRQFGLWNE